MRNFFRSLRRLRQPSSTTNASSRQHNMNDQISVTVRVPFSGDHSISCAPSITVKHLCEKVLETCPPDLFHGVPQCIVHQGRILPDESTLTEASITNGAVLHLMRKPISPDRNPQPANPSENAHHHHENHDSDHHHHHHHHHANVVFGHIAYDGRMQLADVQSVLASVLQALGFSRRAVQAGSSSGAAVALSNQSTVERSGASLAMVNVAWSDARSAIQSLQRDQSAAPIPELSASNPATALVAGDSNHRIVRRASGIAADTLFPSLAAMLRQLANQIEHASPSQISPDERREQDERLLESMGSVSTALTSATALISTLMPDSEPEPRDFEILRRFNSDDPPPPLPDLSFMSRPAQSSDAQAPDSDNTGSEDAPPAETTSRGDTPTGNTDDADANTTREEQSPAVNVDNSSGDMVTENITVSVHLQPDVDGVASTVQDSFVERQQREQSGLAHSARPEANAARPIGETGNASSARRARRTANQSSREQESNADFVIRLVAFYFNSLIDVDTPEDVFPQTEGETAASVLQSVYASHRTPEPENVCLQALLELMNCLTPAQFHAVCRGDFRPLSAVQDFMWEYIRNQCVHSLPSDQATDDVDVYKLFVELVCESLHEFIHVVETADCDIAAEQLGYEVDRNFDFCSHVMHAVEHKAYDFIHIFEKNGGGSRDDFAQRLRSWLIEAFGDVATIMMSCLELGWNDFMNVLRKAIHEVGVSIVGSQYSVIFPFIGNLFTTRATNCHHLTVANTTANRQSDSQDRDPDNNSRQDRAADPSFDGASARQNYRAARSPSSAPPPADSNRDSSQAAAENAASDSMNLQSNRAAGAAADDPNQPLNSMDPDLDDDDMDELAAELGSEYGSAPDDEPEAPGQEDSSDFEQMVRELQSEVPTSSGRTPGAFAANQSAPNVRRPMGFASALSQSANGIGGISSRLGAASTMFPNMSSYSSQASAPLSGGLPRTGARSSDEFDAVFGMRQGAKWRRVVQEDERRMQSSRRAPLSRGYRGEQKQVPVLDVESARKHAVEAVREVSREARLSESQQQALENTARENAVLYLREFESALEGRLATDPDFNRQAFPDAAARFSRTF